MNAERAQAPRGLISTRPELFRPHEIGAPLDLVYDIPNEVNLLASIESHQRRHMYARESIGRMLDEHVGRLKFGKRIPGFLMPDGTAEFLGVNMTESWKRTARMQGEWSRYWDESVGYLNAMDMLCDPNCDAVVIESPEDMKDRRYAYVIEKAGPSSDQSTPIVQYNIMREGEEVDFDHAFREYRKIEGLAGIEKEDRTQIQVNSDMLQAPIPIRNLTPNLRQEIYGVLGISSEEICQAEIFHSNLEHFFGRHIDAFAQLMVDLSDKDSCTDEEISFVKLLRDKIYLEAYEQQDELLQDQTENVISFQLEKVRRTDPGRFILQGDQQEARYYGSLICETITDRTKATYLRQGAPMSAIVSAMTPTEARADKNLCQCFAHQEPHFHCKGEAFPCNHPIPVGYGISTCPSCGAGKVC
ncbi:MAG: hypothetical protein ACMG6E_01550 [Candidatus Roizmanbacteria bacterium]